MYLILSILLAAILGWLLFAFGPFVAGILAFGIVAGSLFRVLFLLDEIRKRLSGITVKPGSPEEVLEEYIRERDRQG